MLVQADNTPLTGPATAQHVGWHSRIAPVAPDIPHQNLPGRTPLAVYSPGPRAPCYWLEAISLQVIAAARFVSAQRVLAVLTDSER